MYVDKKQKDYLENFTSKALLGLPNLQTLKIHFEKYAVFVGDLD